MLSFLRRLIIILTLGLLFCGNLFSQDILDTYLNGNDLNNRINNYIKNVSGLIPETTTLQNVWHLAPAGNKFYFGAGANGNIAFINKKKIGGFLAGSDGFGANNIDLTQFPETIPFLPGLGLDARIGFKNFDFGVTGTWIGESALSGMNVNIFGEGSTFALQSFGIDARYTLKLKIMKSPLWPNITFQAGYFFTRLHFGMSAEEGGRSEGVRVDFRNDSYLLGLQVSKDFLGSLITPYGGLKMIIHKTNSQFEWHTNRPVSMNGLLYPNGLEYYSKGNEGDTKVYSQFYFGLGIYLVNAVSFSVGGAYTFGNHFSLTASMRYVMGR